MVQTPQHDEIVKKQTQMTLGLTPQDARIHKIENICK